MQEKSTDHPYVTKAVDSDVKNQRKQKPYLSNVLTRCHYRHISKTLKDYILECNEAFQTVFEYPQLYRSKDEESNQNIDPSPNV